MPINTFYTLFWILYFPLCIAFYDVNPALQYSDEILTLVLVFFTITTFFRSKDKYIKNEIAIYLFLMAFYVIYSLYTSVNVSDAVWLDLQQQVRPYAVFYCTWLLRPQFTKLQKKWIIFVVLATFFYYLIMFLINPDSVSKFGGEESATLGQLALDCAMVYYLFSRRTRRNLYICLFIMSLGLLGGKSKFFGEMVVFVALFYFLKGRIRLGSFKTLMQFSVITAVVLFFTWTKFNAYYVQGFDEDAKEMARPMSYKTAMIITFKDYVPFGSGLGTFGTNAAAEYYSPLYYKYSLDEIWGLDSGNPMFLADAFYPTLAEYGIVGIIFFFLFWRRRLLTVLRLPDDRYYKVGLMCIFALALESTADTSYLSGKGMGYFMLLGFCLSSCREKFLFAKDKSIQRGKSFS